MAHDAEAHLIRYSSTYRPWPSTPLPTLATAHPPPPLDSTRKGRTNPQDPSLSSQELDSPMFANPSPHYPRTLDSPLSSVHSAPIFSPALRTDSTPRSYGAVEGTPTSSCEDHLPELPPIQSPAPGCQSQLSKSTEVPAPLEPSPRETLAETPNGNVGQQRKRKAIALGDLDDGKEKVAIEATEGGDSLGPRTRRRSGSQTYHAERDNNRHLPSLERSPDGDLRTPSAETASNRDPTSPSNARSISPNRTAQHARPIGSGSSPSEQATSPPVQPLHLLQPPTLQLRHGRDVKMILSLDGDGVRGLSQAFLVEALVGAICAKVNKNIEPFQIFDVVGGCSMGGLLAVMLGRLRLSALAAREAYKYVAREAFQNKKDFFASSDPHAVPPIQDDQAVEDAIKTVVAAELPDVEEYLYDSRGDSANV